MGVIGVTPEEQTDIFRLLAAILHLGNLTFKKGRDGAEIESTAVAQTVARLLGVELAMLEKALCNRTVSRGVGGRGSPYLTPLNLDDVRALFASGPFLVSARFPSSLRFCSVSSVSTKG